MKKVFRWFANRLKDLFYATGNDHLELGRLLTGILTALTVFAVYWNAIHLGQAIDLKGFLTGIAAFAASAGIGIAAKDWVRNKLIKKPPVEEEKCEDESA